MDGIEPEEKIEETIEDIFKREKNNVDGKIEDIFIDDNEVFENDDITEDDKYFIRSLINKTNFSHKIMKKMAIITLTLPLKKLM